MHEFNLYEKWSPVHPTEKLKTKKSIKDTKNCFGKIQDKYF